MRAIRRSLLVLGVVVLGVVVLGGLAGGWALLSSEDWCTGERARQLRTRNFPHPVVRTVDDLLARARGDEILLIAHRGNFTCDEADGAPENSLPGVANAIRMGFSGYETDLRRTRDGRYLIFHDTYVGRTTEPDFEPTDPPRRIESFSFDEMRSLRLTYESGSVSSERIPTLRELLDAGGGRILFLIEVKGPAPLHFAEILDIVRDAGAIDHVLLWMWWEPEFLQVVQAEWEAGVEEARSRVVWRISNLEEYQDVVDRFDPAIIDIRPETNELRLERFLGITPRRHTALVRRALDDGIVPLISRLTTRSMLESLYEVGARVFMTRAPEQHLDFIIEAGLEPVAHSPET